MLADQSRRLNSVFGTFAGFNHAPPKRAPLANRSNVALCNRSLGQTDPQRPIFVLGCLDFSPLPKRIYVVRDCGRWKAGSVAQLCQRQALGVSFGDGLEDEVGSLASRSPHTNF